MGFLEACHTSSHEYFVQHKNVLSSQTDEVEYLEDSIGTTQTNGISRSEHDSPSDDGAFKLTIRSTAAKEIIVTVRPTTTCGKIVENFIKRAGLKPNKKARLQIDGESMKPEVTIADTDLEDGDMVDIVGL